MALAADEALLDEKPYPVCNISSLSLVSSDTPAASKPVHLPTELVLAILSFLPSGPSSQSIFHACILVSRQWYEAGLPYLYHSPHLTPRNFKHFAATVCPSSPISRVRRDELADLVVRLDMSHLVHNGSNLTARLLGRMKDGLEEFVAPQATFAWAENSLTGQMSKRLTGPINSVNCFAALSKCSSLRLLDLSLISESIALSDLFNAMKSLTRLQKLYFPRSSNYNRGFSVNCFTWPPNLHVLTLAGGISDNFLLSANNIPTSVDTLTIEYCPFAKGGSIRTVLAKLAPQLTSLKVSYNIPTLHYNALDRLLLICPYLRTLTVAVDYISSRFFDEDNSPKPSHPLRLLSLESSGSLGVGQKVGPNDIYIAVCEGGLANLRQVWVSERLGWTSAEIRADVRDLVDLLEEKVEEDRTREELRLSGCLEKGPESEDSEEMARWKEGHSAVSIPYALTAGVWTFAS